MTGAPPPPSGRHPRPDRSGRQRALGLESGSAVDGADGNGSVGPSVRPSLRDELARIPDLDSATTQAAPAPVAKIEPVRVGAAAGGTAKVSPPPGQPAPPELTPRARPPRTPAPAVPPVEPSAEPKAVPAEPKAAPVADAPLPPNVYTPASVRTHVVRGRVVGAPVPVWRRVLFGLTIAGLVLAIPVLAYGGYRIISNSTDGTFTSTTNNPEDPGYEAQVEPTPTAVVIQYDAAHQPVGATFLSLSTSDGGGGIVYVPLDTEVAKPAMGVDSLRKAYDIVKANPTFARDQLATEVGKLLNVGIEEVAELDDAGWAQLVAPVAPLHIDSPEPVQLPDGTTVPSGQAELTAAQVGPYLAARKPGESDLARLNRNEAVWRAWLDQVAEAGPTTAIPGELNAGIGKFASALAQGSVSYQTLPVDRIAFDPSGRYRVKPEEVRDLVTNLVPSPTPAAPGSRFTVRLLDGVSAGGIPLDLTRQIVRMGGSVTVIGNGPEFGIDKTTVVYADPAKAAVAKVVLNALGGTGKATLNREAPDTVDLTIVLGKDVLGSAPATTSAPPATSSSTTPGAVPGLTTTSGGA